MQFLSLLIAMALWQYWGSGKVLQKDDWFYQWQSFCNNQLENTNLCSLLVIFLPVMALILVFNLIGSWFGGLIELFMSVVVLIYSLGRGEFSSLLDEYCDAWAEADYKKLPAIVERVDAECNISFDEDVEKIHYQARDSFIYTAFTRFFVVLFWFVFFGPAAALLYRLLRLHMLDCQDSISERLRYLMEWPAGRIYGLTMIFEGDLQKTISSWILLALDINTITKDIVCENALNVLGFGMDWNNGKRFSSGSLQDVSQMAQQETYAIQQLLKHSLFVAVLGFAIIEIIV